MYRREVLGFSIAAATVLLPGRTIAQQQSPQTSIKDLLVGAWTVLLVDGKKADGTQVPLFGPNPNGSLIFAANGRFS